MINKTEIVNSPDINTFFIVETIRLTLKRGGYIFTHNKIYNQIKNLL
jgi:hypothetical protein